MKAASVGPCAGHVKSINTTGSEMKRAYVSALGIMGRRHVVGLVRKGYHVDCFDPSDAAHEALAADLERNSLDKGLVERVEAGAGSYQAAIFTEHADLRFGNVGRFLDMAQAERVLLEKPLSSDPDEVEAYAGLFARKGMSDAQVSGNFTRRAWAPFHRLKAICDTAEKIHMSVHGGAYGIGGNGIHHMDLFLYLTGDLPTHVSGVELFEPTIRSGRGDRFVDYGGTFELRNQRGMMRNVCVPTSSVAPLVMITGENFSAIINERTLEWELAVRKPESTLPPYRCGADYEVIESGVMDYLPMDHVSGLWAEAEIELPDLSTILTAHRLLHECLEKAGIGKPFRYT